VYGKYFNRADTVLPNGLDAQDAWQKGQGGFRMDWNLMEKSRNLLSLQGDLYSAVASTTLNTYQTQPGDTGRRLVSWLPNRSSECLWQWQFSGRRIACLRAGLPGRATG
jgi:hypothetical protein